MLKDMTMKRHQEIEGRSLESLVYTSLERLAPLFAPLMGYGETSEDFYRFVEEYKQDSYEIIIGELNPNSKTLDLHGVGEIVGEFLHGELNESFYRKWKSVKRKFFGVMDGEQEDCGALKEGFEYLNVMGFIRVYSGLFAHWENPSTRHTSQALLTEAEENLTSDDEDNRAVAALIKASINVVRAAEYFFTCLDKKEFQHVLEMEDKDAICLYIREKSGIDIR